VVLMAADRLDSCVGNKLKAIGATNDIKKLSAQLSAKERKEKLVRRLPRLPRRKKNVAKMCPFAMMRWINSRLFPQIHD
jgi:hypothetical protein